MKEFKNLTLVAGKCRSESRQGLFGKGGGEGGEKEGKEADPA